jgi:hypothetical protein
MQLQSRFSFTSFIGQINFKKRDKLHNFISNNYILKASGGFITNYTSAIISGTLGQFLSQHKKTPGVHRDGRMDVVMGH